VASRQIDDSNGQQTQDRATFTTYWLTNFEEEWQTKEGSGAAKKEDGTRKRYLPRKAWEELSEREKEETRGGRRRGRAKRATRKVNEEERFESRRAKERGEHGQEDDENDDDGEEGEAGVDEEVEDEAEDDEEDFDDSEDEGEDEGDEEGVEEEDEDDVEADVEDEKKDEPKRGTKRTRGAQNGTSKKQKSNSGNAKQSGTVGSRHDPANPPAQQGSVDRLPKKGQQVHWKALPGFVDGEVVEVLTKGKDVEGKKVKASEKDPRIVLKSSSSGKICVHKPDACYFD
ncbi:hypothetical protein LTS18_007638, partial [Coniosporium uncinatum]